MADMKTTLPNQSLLDMILTKYGSLETGLHVAAANDIPLSHIPLTGADIEMPASTDVDEENLAYISRERLQLGTLARNALNVEVLLKPRVKAIPNVIGNPHTIGYYSFDLVADTGFLNTYPLANIYPDESRLYYITEERHISGYASESALPLSVTPMPTISLPYQLLWTVGLGYMMVYSSHSQPLKTVTFRDVAGNEAYCAPLTVFDNVSQNVAEHLSGDIGVEVVSATPSYVTVRLTRTHPVASLADFINRKTFWLYDALEGIPDPDDPTNANKTLLTLAPGTYTIGAITTYYYLTPPTPHAYPSSSFSMVIRVA